MSVVRRRLALALVALLLSALFARLGFWQLERHGERREAAERGRERMAMPSLHAAGPADLARLPPAESLAWRRIELEGRWDPEREILLAPRSHEGRPAVELLTPLLLGPDTAVLVLRGWLPSPDALHAPVRRARPPAGEATVCGVALRPASSPADPEGRDRAAGRRVVVDGEERLALRRIDLETASDHLPYLVMPFYVRMLTSGATGSALRPPPPLEAGAGPHLSYAIQWFAFALITLVGTGFLLRRGG